MYSEAVIRKPGVSIEKPTSASVNVAQPIGKKRSTRVSSVCWDEEMDFNSEAFVAIRRSVILYQRCVVLHVARSKA